MIITKPKLGEYREYAQIYIDNLPNDINLIDHLIQNLNSLVELIETIPESKLLYRYAENKWTILEVLVHIIDTERVFAYRAFAIARDPETVLLSMNENVYADNCNANERNIVDIVDELKSVRLATISLFKSFNQNQFDIIGKTTESNLSVRAIPFFILGHTIHHINILKEKYLIS